MHATARAAHVLAARVEAGYKAKRKKNIVFYHDICIFNQAWIKQHKDHVLEKIRPFEGFLAPLICG